MSILTIFVYLQCIGLVWHACLFCMYVPYVHGEVLGIAIKEIYHSQEATQFTNSLRLLNFLDCIDLVCTKADTSLVNPVSREF